MTADIGLADKVERIHLALSRSRIPHAFGGALALAYYATPRTTVDIDVNVFVATDRYDFVSAALHRAGADLSPKTAEVDKHGQVRVFWGATPIDLFFSYDEIHEAMQGAVRKVPFGQKTIPILAPEHLAVAKIVFDRAKDWLDIEQILIAVDELDTNQIERWLIHLVGHSDPRLMRFKTISTELRGPPP